MSSVRIVKFAFRAGLMPIGMALLYLLHFYIARIHGAEGYGEFVFSVAIGSILAIVVTGGGPASAQKFIAYYRAKRDSDNERQFIAYGLWYLCFSSLVVLGVAAILVLFGELYNFEYQIYLNALVVTAATLIWLWQRYTCLGYGRVVLALVPRDLMMPAILVIVLISTTNSVSIDQFLYYYAIVTALCCIPALYICTRGASGVKLQQLKTTELGSWLRSGRSFMVTTGLQLGLNSWDLIILGIFAGLDETGRYAAASRLAMMLMIVIRIVNTLVGHKFSSMYANDNFERVFVYFREVRRYCIYAGLVIFALLIVSHQYIFQVIGDDYVNLSFLLFTIAIANLLCVAMGPIVQLLNMTGMEAQVAKSMLVWSLLSIVGNLIAIPIIGANGAALIYVITNIGMRWQLTTRMNDIMYKQ